MSNPTRPRATRAFTLIELLTVIAIIGILAAILIPTVGAVRSRALKSQCASNLRQLGVAVNLFVNDNKQVLPNGAQGNSSLQWLSVENRNALVTYGMNFQMFFCRGNLNYTELHATESNRTLAAGSHPIGYVYLPGTTFTAKDRFGRDIPSKYRETRMPKLTYRLIAADLNRTYNGSFADGTNHSAKNIPIGGNHLYIDGAVKWFPADDFIERPAITGNGTEYFYKTED